MKILLKLISLTLVGYLSAQIDFKLPPNLTVPNLIQQYGYPCEEHIIRTHDGYILNIHRIPHGSNRAEQSSAIIRPPVLLQHGTYSSSGVWVANKENLAFLLADSGFDVWLANVRGNEYGRQHEKFDINSHGFWNFTIDDIAKYDFPAIVDYIILKTERETIQKIPSEHIKQLKFPKAFEKNQKLPKIQSMQEIPSQQQQKQKQIKGMSHLQETFKKLGIDMTTLNQLLPGNCAISCEKRVRGLDEMNDDEMKNFFNSHGISLDSIKAFVPEPCEIRCPKTPPGQHVSLEKHSTGSLGLDKLTTKCKEVINILPSSRTDRTKMSILEPKNEVEMKKREIENSELGGKISEGQNKVANRKLSIVAFGKGALIGLGQISRDPQLANQVKLFVALGPGTGKSANSSAPLFKLLKSMDISYLNDLKDQLFTRPDEKIDLITKLPIPNTKLVYEYISNPERYFYFIGGENRHVDKNNIPIYLNYLLSGTSKTNLIYMVNMLKSGGIYQMFDLKNACIPVALFSGGLDEVSTKESLDYLRQTLPEVVLDETINDYGHLDLLFANDLNERIGHKIVKLFKEYP